MGMSTGEVMGGWLALALVAAMSLTAAAQGTGERPNLPAAPSRGNAVPLTTLTPQDAAPTTVEPVVPIETPAYTPLSAHQKFHIFLQQTYSAYTFANTAFDAGWAQMTDDWPAYGQGTEGYGKRYGALLANHEAGSFFENFLFPTLLRQDPRYFRMGSGDGMVRRVSYAVSRVGITRADDGHNTFNSSLLLGLLFVDGLTNAYYPRPQRGFDDTMSRFGGGLISSAETNLLREFWPDMVRVFHKHEPEKLKKLEELEKKMPLSDKLSPPTDSTVSPPSQSQPAKAQPAAEAGGPAPRDASVPPSPKK